MVGVVVVRPGFPVPPAGLTDSRRLTAKRREALAAALRRAAARALESLPVRPDVVLLDGKHDYIGRPWTVRTIIKADLHSVSVAAASVIAKVCRDRLMDDIGEDYPDFAFAASPAADRERQARRPPSATAGSKCRTAKPGSGYDPGNRAVRQGQRAGGHPGRVTADGAELHRRVPAGTA